MPCPDLDRLIAYSLGEHDPWVEEHISSCRSCQEDFGLLLLLPTAAAEPAPTPERLVGLVMDGLAKEEVKARPRRTTVGHRFVAAVLGFLTSGGALFLTGSPGEGGVELFFLISLVMGLVSGALPVSSNGVCEQKPA